MVEKLNDPLLSEAIRLYRIPPETLTPLPGGHYARVYAFCRGGADYVLRLTPPDDDFDLDAALRILEWTNFLAGQGAAVPRPVPSDRGRLIETARIDGGERLLAVYEKAAGTLAEDLPGERWDEALFRDLGAAVGRLHALARAYPPEAAGRHPAWDEVHNGYNPVPDRSEDALLARREEVLSELARLPRDPSGWGLIHADLHGGNLLVDPVTRRITILDFDDCCRGWFGMDIAMSVLDMTVLYAGADRDAFARRFLEPYLAGYRTGSPLSPFWAAQIPRFLKLLEIGLYFQCAPIYHPGDRDSWVGKFMPGRREGIQTGAPFVELDFEQAGR